MEIIKGLRKQIEEKAIGFTTIREALPDKYKQSEQQSRGNQFTTGSVAKEDLLSKEIHLLEEVAGLTIKQIFGMEVGEFLVKYRQFYAVHLKGLSSHDVHLQSKKLERFLNELD